MEQSILDESDSFYNTIVKIKHKKQQKHFLKPPTKLQAIFGARNQPRSKYYFTDDEYKDQKSLNDYLYSKNRPSGSYEALKTKIKEKYGGNGHKFVSAKDVRSRIGVAQPPSDETIVDIDPDFYDIIEGRPIKERFVLKDYIGELKESAVSNLLSGYLNDETMKLDEIYLRERIKYEEVCKEFNECVDNIENYLNEDYDKTKKKSDEAEAVFQLLTQKNKEYDELCVEHGILTRKFYVLEEKCRLAKIYQEFLYQISPLDWQKQFTSYSDNGKEPYEQIKDTLARYQIVMVGEGVPTIEELKSIFREAFRGEKSELYFTEPWQLKKIFNRIETLNLTSWSNFETLTEILDKLVTNLMILKQNLTKEFEEIQDCIDNLDRCISNEERHESKLRQTMEKIINADFHDVSTSEDALKCDVCIRDVYEKVIFKNLSFKTSEMIRTLETEYEDNMKLLDNMNAESVMKTQKLCYSEDLKAMKMASDATKQLKNLEKLFKHLKNSFV